MNTPNSPAADIAVNLVERVLREITFHHDKLKVWVESMGRVQILYVQCHKGDMPRVIGKHGAHRNALFNLVEYIGLRYSTELRMENVEPQTGEVERFAPFVPSRTWDSGQKVHGPIVQLLRDFCQSVFAYETLVSITDSSHTPTSRLQVIVSDQEQMQRTVRIAEALKVLFNAVGKKNGRILLVDVIAQSEFDRMQNPVVK
jgi:predicted RNA-binding protein YlqC (UPF0109 family)